MYTWIGFWKSFTRNTFESSADLGIDERKLRTMPKDTNIETHYKHKVVMKIEEIMIIVRFHNMLINIPLQCENIFLHTFIHKSSEEKKLENS